MVILLYKDFLRRTSSHEEDLVFRLRKQFNHITFLIVCNGILKGGIEGHDSPLSFNVDEGDLRRNKRVEEDIILDRLFFHHLIRY